MDVLRGLWDLFGGIIGLIVLTAGTFVFVAGEFALASLERSTPREPCRSSSPVRKWESRSPPC